MSSFLDIYKMMNYKLEFHFLSILSFMLLFVRILYYNNKNETWAPPNGLYVRGSSAFCSQVCDTHIEKFCRLDMPSLCCSRHTHGPAYSPLPSYWPLSSLLNQSQQHISTQCKQIFYNIDIWVSRISFKPMLFQLLEALSKELCLLN